MRSSVVAQEFAEWELVVIDDASKDESDMIGRKAADSDSRIRYVRNKENLGLQRTLNLGLGLCAGEFIARIDHDDEWCDVRKLSAQLRFFDAHLDHVLVGTGAIVTDQGGIEMVRYLLPGSDEEIRKRMLFKNCFVHSSVLFKRDLTIELGGYSEDSEVRHIEDYDLWLRLGKEGKMANLPTCAVRLHSLEDGISASNRLDQARKFLKLSRKHLHEYPNGGWAKIVGWLRMLAYELFGFMPASWKRIMFRFYKQA